MKNKMKDSDIIKALECCISFVSAEEVPCNECPLHNYDDCLTTSRQLAIDRLKTAKSEAIKEYIKRFEKNIKNVQFTLGQTREIQSALKQTKEEMVGE